jgi:uncharacterized lipoprotein NlpE involved in copper resistance
MKSILFLSVIMLTLLGCSGNRADKTFAGSWTGNLLVDGQTYNGVLSIVLVGDTAFSGNLMLYQNGKLVNSAPFNGTIMGNQAIGQTFDNKPTAVALTLTNGAITALFRSDEGSVKGTFVRNAAAAGAYAPDSPIRPEDQSEEQVDTVAENQGQPDVQPDTPAQNQGHDPNLSAINWMTKDYTSNFIIKRFKKLLPDGSIDGYKLVSMPSVGEYDNPQPEPDETIERWKQQGVRWYTTNNSVICLTLPEGTQCYRYQINGDDLNFYNNEGQVVMSWELAGYRQN